MLEIELQHRFPGFVLSAGFAAPRGVTALFGRSGAGKTTIVNAIAGLLRPDAGRVAVDGEVLLDTARGIALQPHRRAVGYVFQDGRLFPHLSVRQNLGYGRWFSRRRAGGDEAGEFDRVVTLLGIGDLLDRRPGALSGGEKQRVAIGRALLSRPRLLLLDEPLAALDGARKAEILPYLERLRDETKVPILYVSHSATEIARLATTVVLLEAGHVVLAGPVAEVLADPAGVAALGPREVGAVIAARIEAQEDDGLTRLASAAGPLWLPRIAGAPGTATRVRVHAHDVMLALTRPTDISALNVLPARVTEIRAGAGPGALVQLQAGEAMLLARVTRRSVAALGLAPGRDCFAVIKAVSVAQGDVGAAG